MIEIPKKCSDVKLIVLEHNDANIHPFLRKGIDWDWGLRNSSRNRYDLFNILLEDQLIG